MAKQIVYAQKARQKLQSGVDQLAKAVATTLGPKGRNVALDKKWGAPAVIHDGVTVAKEIELKDPFENMGAQLVKEAASKTADVAGDGTTTAIVIAQSIVDEGIKNITAGTNPMLLKRGLEEASAAVVEFIKSKGGIELSVDADLKVRYERIVKRGSEKDKISFEEFKKEQAFEMMQNDPNKNNLGAAITKADFHLTNDGTQEELEVQVEKALQNKGPV